MRGRRKGGGGVSTARDSRSRSLQRMVRRFGSFLLVDVGGIGLSVADGLENAGAMVTRVRRGKDGAWREVTAKSSVEPPQAPKP